MIARHGSHRLGRPGDAEAKPSEPVITMVAFAAATGASPSADPVIGMVAFASTTDGAEGFAFTSDPVITMAAFESGGPAPCGSIPAVLTCRETVSRSTPSSAAIRRYDQLSRASPMIA